MVPVAALPPVTPFTFQVTAILAVLVTLAVNCLVAPTASDAVEGATVTLTGLVVGGVRLTSEIVRLWGSTGEKAITRTLVAALTTAGAV